MNNNKNIAIDFLFPYIYFFIIFLTFVQKLLLYSLLPCIILCYTFSGYLRDFQCVFLTYYNLPYISIFATSQKNQKNQTALLTLLLHFCSLSYCFYIIYLYRYHKHHMTQLLLFLCTMFFYICTHIVLPPMVFLIVSQCSILLVSIIFLYHGGNLIFSKTIHAFCGFP